MSFEDGRPVKASFTVSKRNFKRAVKRNHLKRLMRESYRLNKGELARVLDEKNEQLAIMFIYAVKELKDYDTVEKGMLKSLEKLKTILSYKE